MALAPQVNRPAPLASLDASTTTQQQPAIMMNYRVLPPAAQSQAFTSPTESVFSEGTCDGDDSVRNWDEDKVGDWLKSIACSQYVKLFRDNNITGENLMEMSQTDFRELGIKRVGDRVRISSQAKVFRNREYRKASHRQTIRESLVGLNEPAQPSPSSSSPRPLHSARSLQSNGSSRYERRLSQKISGQELKHASAQYPTRSSSRPASPRVDQDPRNVRGQREQGMSPRRDGKRERSSSYLIGQPSSGTPSARSPATPAETPQTARHLGQTTRLDDHGNRTTSHKRLNPNVDAYGAASSLPDKAVIKVIFDNGQTKMMNVHDSKSAQDVILKALRKGNLNEAHVKSYCFYVLDGVVANPVYCRRLSDEELLKICMDKGRIERGRLMLRKIHLGEPEAEQLQVAAKIAAEQAPQLHLPSPGASRSQQKIEKLTGEHLAAVSYPMSPGTVMEREKRGTSPSRNLARSDSGETSVSTRVRKLKAFYGARPPSELIASDLTSYFPDVRKEEIDRTSRMLKTRSQRISRALSRSSRMSTVSDFSAASSVDDAPPLPTIADGWLTGQRRQLRPLSVVRLGRPASNYRESVASTILEPLDEEFSPQEPNRKSYVSMGDESSAESASVSVTDPDGNVVSRSYSDISGSSPDDASIKEELSQALAEDGEEADEELTEFLQGDSWDNIRYMKGALIGKGSFGSVYLALHAVTGELMAVKQVDLPSSTGSALDTKKNNMLEALKHEIALLRELRHPNIVQYLGSSSDDRNLNIFLEYVAGGSVATMLTSYGPLNEDLVSRFVRQILIGLAYLHSKDIIHRDIKGANILVDNKGAVKISDFGISKRVEASSLFVPGCGGKRAGPRVSLQGSVFWMAPEVVKQTAYTRKADIWSLGCLIVEMFTGSRPHPNLTQLQAIFKIGGSDDASPPLPDVASEEAWAFLRRTFVLDHELRPEAAALLRSEWLNEKGPVKKK